MLSFVIKVQKLQTYTHSHRNYNKMKERKKYDENPTVEEKLHVNPLH